MATTQACSNPHYSSAPKFAYARSKMPGLWFIFRGDPFADGERIAEAWREATAKMITDALNQTQ